MALALFAFEWLIREGTPRRRSVLCGLLLDALIAIALGVWLR